MDKKERNKIAVAKYRLKNKDKIKAYNKKWSEDNKELKASLHKKWNDENKDKVKVYNKQWKIDNPEKVKINEKNRDHVKKRQSKKQWAKNNHDNVKISGWKSYGIITTDWNNVYDVYINTTNCNYCNKKFKNTLDRCLDHDHSIKDNNNIRGIICRPCNTKDVLAGYPTIF